MCGRFSIATDVTHLETRFNASFHINDAEDVNPVPNYNVAPTQFVPVLRGDDRSHFTMMNWGLIPSWSKSYPTGNQLINARIETLHEKPSFRNLIHNGRCIIPMDGFYEWKKVGKDKVPYRIMTSDQTLFGVAGLCTEWVNPSDNSLIKSFTMITLPANEFMSSIHTRMPAILTPHQEKLWLDTGLQSKDAIEILSPYPSELLNLCRVSNKVNSVYERSKDIIDPLNQKDSDTNATQLSLF
ncbi:MAG TPA: SOS response-associated peptidase [Saprospiraceae bacterium]|nr:SOS response-associated peptidase [Saprospiraceae bacterium]HRO09108.1 SOS response-associated peptidase [Saprospiraceae bacterium]HRP42478.1 SOS response-associated peptidase [Saprospiraceae bacterium]